MRQTSLVFLAFASGLSAQTTIAMTAATPIAAITSAAGGAVTWDGIPSGRAIGSSPNNVFLSTSQSPTGVYLSASTIIYPTQSYNGGIGFNFFERAYARGGINDVAGSSASPAQAGAAPGPHAVLATYATAPGTVGNIVVSFRNNGNSTVRAVVDVDNDGTNEVDQSVAGSISIPYTIGASGQVVVRVSNECHAKGNGTSTLQYTWTEMWVAFMPDLTATCTITSYGAGCGGVQATGTEVVTGSQRTLNVTATGCFASNPVIVATGSQRIQLPLLGGCSLLCNAEGVALASADASGSATVSWAIPATVIGTTYVQMLPIALSNGALVLKASNGVDITCTH
ncbi:MAG: hypothetical protein KDC98_16120 [Planctomycetes bacterium]|nr:hypothetical protein [Planctomycetota bacterium]